MLSTPVLVVTAAGWPRVSCTKHQEVVAKSSYFNVLNMKKARCKCGWGVGENLSGDCGDCNAAITKLPKSNRRSRQQNEAQAEERAFDEVDPEDGDAVLAVVRAAAPSPPPPPNAADEDVFEMARKFLQGTSEACSEEGKQSTRDRRRCCSEEGSAGSQGGCRSPAEAGCRSPPATKRIRSWIR